MSKGEAKAAQHLAAGRAKLDETLSLTFGPEISIDFVSRALCHQFDDQARARVRDLKAFVDRLRDNESQSNLRDAMQYVIATAEQVVENLDRYERAYEPCSQQL